MNARVKRGGTTETDADRAASDLARQIKQPNATTFIFAAPGYELGRLEKALNACFEGAPVVGCTTSGELSPSGYREGSLVGFSVPHEMAEIIVYPMADLTEMTPLVLAQVGHEASRAYASAQKETPVMSAFGLLFVDGMSSLEEAVIANLTSGLTDIPVVGGSAGDNQAFHKTHVFYNGAFHSDAAVFCLFLTERPYTIFQSQHFEPTAKKLVITKAQPDQRLVTRIDGRPAAQAYADIVGCPIEALDEIVFSMHPLMIKIQGTYYVRSIQRRNPDDSLTFYCAIDEGLVLTVAKGADIVRTLQTTFEDIHTRVPQPELIIGFECILRRVEVRRRGLEDRMSQIMADHSVVGFHSYGEQHGFVHVNQTFTGVAIGGGQ